MDTRKIGKQAAEILSMMMIGEGAIVLLNPHGHLRLWRGLSATTDRWIDAFEGRPELTRALGAAELLAGLILAGAVLPRRCKEVSDRLPPWPEARVEQEVFEAVGQI